MILSSQGVVSATRHFGSGDASLSLSSSSSSTTPWRHLSNTVVDNNVCNNPSVVSSLTTSALEGTVAGNNNNNKAVVSGVAFRLGTSEHSAVRVLGFEVGIEWLVDDASSQYQWDDFRVQVYTYPQDYYPHETNNNAFADNDTDADAFTTPDAWTLVAETTLVFPQSTSLTQTTTRALVPGHAFESINMDRVSLHSIYLRIVPNTVLQLRAERQPTVAAGALVGATSSVLNLYGGTRIQEDEESGALGDFPTGWGEPQYTAGMILPAARVYYQVTDCPNDNNNNNNITATLSLQFEHLVATTQDTQLQIESLEQFETLQTRVGDEVQRILDQQTDLLHRSPTVLRSTALLRGCLGRVDMAVCQSLLVTVQVTYRAGAVVVDDNAAATTSEWLLLDHILEGRVYQQSNAISAVMAANLPSLKTSYYIGWERVAAPLQLEFLHSTTSSVPSLTPEQLRFLQWQVVEFLQAEFDQLDVQDELDNPDVATSETARVLEWTLESTSGGGDDSNVLIVSGTVVGAQLAQERLQGNLNYFAKRVQRALLASVLEETGSDTTNGGGGGVDDDGQTPLVRLKDQLRYQAQVPSLYLTTTATDGNIAEYQWFVDIIGISTEVGNTEGTLDTSDNKKKNVRNFWIIFFGTCIAFAIIAWGCWKRYEINHAKNEAIRREQKQQQWEMARELKRQRLAREAEEEEKKELEAKIARERAEAFEKAQKATPSFPDGPPVSPKRHSPKKDFQKAAVDLEMAAMGANEDTIGAVPILDDAADDDEDLSRDESTKPGDTFIDEDDRPQSPMKDTTGEIV